MFKLLFKLFSLIVFAAIVFIVTRTVGCGPLDRIAPAPTVTVTVGPDGREIGRTEPARKERNFRIDKKPGKLELDWEKTQIAIGMLGENRNKELKTGEILHIVAQPRAHTSCRLIILGKSRNEAEKIDFSMEYPAKEDRASTEIILTAVLSGLLAGDAPQVINDLLIKKDPAQIVRPGKFIKETDDRIYTVETLPAKQDRQETKITVTPRAVPAT